MRAFIVLCLVAVATADKLGYNYQPVQHSSSGLSFSPGDIAGIGAASKDEPVFAAPSSSSFSSSPSSFAPSFAAPSSSDEPLSAAPSSSAPSQLEPAAELNKQFFTYTANDEDFVNPAASEQASNYLKQGLRVVFIKGPERNGLEDAALALAKQASEDNTAIYVLNKQADISDLANKFNAVRNDNAHKPEVHFVKYRTPEDAGNAVQQIQNQYDSLGGASESHDGGVAPVLNFASKAPAPVAQRSQEAAASGPSASYLPASIFRRFRL